MDSLLRLPFTLLSKFQVLQGLSQGAGVDVAAPLCCAQGVFQRGSHAPENRDGLQLRTMDVVKTADQANVEAIATGSSTTRWKRVVSPSTDGSVGVESSSNAVSGGTKFIPLCTSATPSVINASSSISSTSEVISASNSTQLLSTVTNSSIITSPSLFSACVPQTPFPSSTLTQTLMTSASSASSPIVTSRGLTSLRSSTSATSFPPPSTATVITLTTLRPLPSPSFTMSNSDTITLAPINPTSTFLGPGTSQSGLDTTLISPTSSTPFIIPTFISSATDLSPTPSTSDFLSSIDSPSTYPSISAISLSDVDLTSTLTSTSTSDQIITPISSETGALSTNTSHDASFVHQTGAIIGVTIGGAFFVFIIILSILFVCKRRSNRSNNSSLEDILAASRRDTSWHPPLETDDDENYLAYRRPTPPKYTKTSSGQVPRGPFDDPLPTNSGRSGSAESARANGALVNFGGQPPVPQTLSYGSIQPRSPLPNYSSNDNHGNSRPLWGPTEPLNINKHKSSQKLSPTVDSHMSVTGRRSASSLGFGGSMSSNGHLGPGSSGEALLPRGSSNRSTSIPEPPKPIHMLSGRRHYSTPPTAFVGDNSSSFERDTQRVQQQQREEREQEDRANKSISQIILARIRASRRSSNGSIKAYSQCTTLDSERSTPSRTSSNMYSPSLLNPPISISMTVPHPHGVTRSSYTFSSQHFVPLREDVTASSRGVVRWPDVGTLPSAPPLHSAPSPVPTDSSSMVEGLLHPRLGMGLGSSQQASATSLRDHEDYTRPINGLVNNPLRSTTTFDTQNTVELSEGGTL